MARSGGPGKTTPTFTHTFRLDVDEHQKAVLDRRFDAARRLYNAVLSEAMRKAALMRQSRLWTTARRTRDPQQRAALFRQARVTYRFQLFDLFPFVGQCCHAEIGHHLDVTTARGIAQRAYDAVNEWVLGKHGRPRFKSWRRGLRTVAGREHQGIRLVLPETGDPPCGLAVRWKGLHLAIRFRHGRRPSRHGDAHRRLIAHVLDHRVKFVRLMRKVHGSEVRFYAQIVAEGKPLPRIVAGEETVGWDLGVSTSAWVGETAAELSPFAPELADRRKVCRRLLRRIDRQRRAGNPGNYRADGTVRPGCRTWKVSHRQAAVQRQLADHLRRLAEHRRNGNGQLANRIVAQGRHIRTEAVHIRAWTRRFGRQIGQSAPAGGLEAVRRKAESAGGEVLFIPLRAALSQICICGHRERKPLGQRVHHCPRCGLRMQRDLLSAYLARYTDRTVLHADQARERWSAAEPLLLAAWRVPQSAKPPVADCGLRSEPREISVGADRERDGVLWLPWSGML